MGYRSEAWRLAKYDVPVLGKEEGLFVVSHVAALVCIVISLICAIFIIVVSFKRQGFRTFFTKWSKCERFIVYQSACDGLFNISHFMDHFHMLIVGGHVYPLELCEFYAFTVFEFVSAQCFMVLIIAINAFALIKFQKNINFGTKDWRLHCIAYGGSFALCLIAALLGEMGPTGSFCGIEGHIANIFFTTVPMCSVIIIISILYTLTWCHIRRESKRIEEAVGSSTQTTKASYQAAKTMTMFVVAFCIQYWAAALWGVWNAIGNVPFNLFFFVVTFSNIGGILNAIVFIIMQKMRRSKVSSTSGASTYATNS